jgi:hypothetical protein
MFRLIFCLLTILFFAKSAYPQSEYKRVPFYLSWSIKGITKNLCKDAPDDSMKVRAIYVWITHNIRYDVKAWLRYSEKKYSPSRIVRRRKVVCQGYSDLFIKMCQIAGIKALEVAGYDKGIEHKAGQRYYWDEHAWNAVEINNAWYVADLTWSSGYVKVNERSFRKYLFESFGIPYMRNRMKFVRAPNDKYYLQSSDDMIKDHLPADPVFQMRVEPVPMEVYEGYPADTVNVFKKNMNCKAELDMLKDLPYAEAVVRHAGKANSYNRKNNRMLGYACAAYGGSLMKSLPPKLEINPGPQLGNCNIAIKYFKEGIIYLGRFRRDNALVHDIRMDSIKIRNNIINSNVRRFQGINKSIRIKDVTALRQLKKHLPQYGESISNLSRMYRKKSSDNINGLQRNTNPQKYRPEIIAKLKAGIESNNKKIASLSDSAFSKDEHIENYMDSMRVLSVKANETYGISISLISGATTLNINNELRGSLIRTYASIAEIKRLRHEYLQKKDTKTLRAIGADQRQRYASLNTILRLISDNKKRLIQIKKISVTGGDEDQLYIEENQKLLDAYRKTLAYYRELIRVGSMEQSRMKMELRFIKTESKLYKKQLKIQAMKYRAEIKRENFRYKLFMKRADAKMLFCKQGIRAAELRSKILTKILGK